MTERIYMRSHPLTITEVKKKTTAKLFKDLNIGDRIMLSIPVIAVGASRGRSYSVDIKVTNLSNGEYVFKTFNEITPLLNNFIFSQES